MASRILSGAVAALNGAGTILIFLLMILINLDVLMRYAFNSPIDGVTELVELSIVAIVFLQLADTVRCGRLTRSDGFYNRIRRLSPRTGHVLAVIFESAGIFFFAAILYGAVPRLIDAYSKGYYTGNVGIFVFPVWPVRLILVIGCIAVILVFLQFIFRHLAAIRDTGRETG